MTQTEREQYEITIPEHDEEKHSFAFDDSEVVITCAVDCLVEEYAKNNMPFYKII